MTPQEWNALTHAARGALWSQLTPEEIAAIQAAHREESARTPSADQTDSSLSPLRIIANVLAVLVCWVTFAPVGLLHLAPRPRVSADGLLTGFRFSFLALAGLAALFPRHDSGLLGTVGPLPTFRVFGIALLNVGGCASIVSGFRNVT